MVLGERAAASMDEPRDPALLLASLPLRRLTPGAVADASGALAIEQSGNYGGRVDVLSLAVNARVFGIADT